MLGTIMREKRKVSFYPVDEPGVYRVENFKEFRRFVPTKSYFVVRLPRAGEDTVYIVDAFAGSQTNELDFYRIVCESGISVDFPPAVNSSLEALPDSVPEEAKEQRVDLRDLDTFTVDGKDARDLDDAASIRFSGGRITLWIHIADVSAYVEPDTELDREAARRTTSVYLGNRVIPMLPPKLSNGVCSLHPEVDRLALTVEISLNRQGKVKQSSFYRSVIRSDRRYTYEEIDRLIDTDDYFSRIYDLSRRLYQERIDSGAIDFDIPEAKIVFDDSEQVVDLKRTGRTRATGIIEEFMLLANIQVSKMLAKHVPTIFRIHDEPNAEKISRLLPVLDFLHADHDYSRYNTDPAGQMKQIIDVNQDGPHAAFVNTMLLRSMARAEYATKNIGHYGLAFTHYTHFTSPIRRYPDLIIHRQLTRLMENNKETVLKAKKTYRHKTSFYSEKQLSEIAKDCSQGEYKAVTAERGFTQLKAIRFLEDKIGMEYDGKVSAVLPSGCFVQLADHMVEGFLKTQSMGNDFQYHDEGLYLKSAETGRVVQFGTPLRIRVAAVHSDRRHIDFEWVRFNEPETGSEETGD